ncbi:hypothetical protein B0H17DRAFT_1090017 [Mycena rosella]|uniref:Uncharacterized protein n=1 Tax=Mycena rosella TaxID=1033263 RepID=A0AAD7G8J6_MYCRO|nr:hypothetical protein B0H17DRAFT_1090017 [Mycena rosella]
MQELPSELQLKVCSMACLDHGETGSSLSAVSKHVRQLSAKYRYQSIAVSGSIEIQHLLDTLCAVPAHLRRIRFLFLNGYPLGHDKRDQVIGRRRLPHGGTSEQMALDLDRNMSQILLFSSPTVEIISLARFEDVPGLLDHEFPALVHLTVKGPRTLPSSSSFAPALHTLHIAAASLPHEFPSTIIPVCPPSASLNSGHYPLTAFISTYLPFCMSCVSVPT